MYAVCACAEDVFFYLSLIKLAFLVCEIPAGVLHLAFSGGFPPPLTAISGIPIIPAFQALPLLVYFTQVSSQHNSSPLKIYVNSILAEYKF
jgi:hypothetical protein